jgi:sec-independent protein translocase protein TatC
VPTTISNAPEEYQLPLADHLIELRRRLVRVLVAIGAATVVSLGLSRVLLAILLRPVEATYFFAPGEAFAAHLRTALLIGLPLAWPVVLYQLYAFASPGLYPAERRAVRLLLPVGSVLFVAGLAFGYIVMVPTVLLWLGRFATTNITPTISVSAYTSFVVGSIIPFGIAFQLPLAVGVLSRLGVITARGMAGARRWMLLGMLTVAAILTPPDVVSQLVMTLPMVVLYELSIIIARIAGRRIAAE